MLKLTGRQPSTWLEMPHGIRLLARPLGAAGLVACRAASARAAIAGAEDGVSGFAFTVAAARWGVEAWEGIVGEDDQALACTPDNVETLLGDSLELFDAFDAAYVMPALAREQEKNGSSPSPIGASTGARTSADTARRAAKTAPPKSTSRRRTKASASG